MKFSSSTRFSLATRLRLALPRAQFNKQSPKPGLKTIAMILTEETNRKDLTTEVSQSPNEPSSGVTPSALDNEPKILRPRNEIEIKQEIDMETSNSPRQLSEEEESTDEANVGHSNGVVAIATDDVKEKESSPVISLPNNQVVKSDLIVEENLVTQSDENPEIPPEAQYENNITSDLEKPMILRFDMKSFLEEKALMETTSITTHEGVQTANHSPSLPPLASPSVPEHQLLQSDRMTESLRKFPELNQVAQHNVLVKAEINYLKYSSLLNTATRKSVSLIESTLQDAKKQQQTSLLIAELTAKLDAAKSSLNSMNHKVETKAKQIAKSHRKIIKLKSDKDRFARTCQQVGVLKNGDQYSLPNANPSELVDNFKQIADKTEEISKASNEQIIKSQLHFVAERTKSFMVEGHE